MQKACRAIENRYHVSGWEAWRPMEWREFDKGWRRTVELDFAMAVDRLMPKQPWKPGVHKIVEKQLGCSFRQCQEAINVLIDKGIRYQQ